MLLALKEPVALAWGPEFIVLYNDAYVRMYGDKDAAPGLGVGVPISRAEIWASIGQEYEQVLRSGTPIHHKDRLVPVFRHGRLEPVHWTYSFNPVPDDHAPNGIGGVLIVAEHRVETANVMQESDEREAFLLKLSDALRPLGDVSSIEQTLTRLVGEKLDADWVVYGHIEEDNNIVDIGQGYQRRGAPPIAGVLPLSSFGWALPTYTKGINLVVADTQTSDLVPAADRQACAALGMIALVSVPLLKNGELAGALAVSQATPRDRKPADIRLAEQSAERICAIMQRARSEERLRLSEQRFQQFAQASSDVLWMRNAQDFSMEFLSPAFETVYGAPREQAMGDVRRWAALIVPDDRDEALSSTAKR